MEKVLFAAGRGAFDNMLTLLLAWTIALGSLAIFVAGMIFPELSKKNDLIWVGIGLFYALILWANAGKMGGGLVLGQTAGVSMMVWLGIQTMTQRRELTSEDKKTPVPDWLQKIVDFVVPLWQKGLWCDRSSARARHSSRVGGGRLRRRWTG
ncbi:MAG: hypothetical protein HC810_08200 [Acaryochloridaceae cyanobacterium RL_2_7]|nr:hypothetical protein [Acaryochloridaceae cyanobacterium RL_2_7]